MSIFSHRLKKGLCTCTLLTLSLGAGGFLSPAVEAAPDLNSPGAKMFEAMQDHIVQVSDDVKASVVHVEVIAKRGETRNKMLGSGLIISPDGQIVTNFHVIDRAVKVSVILDDRSKYEADIIRRDQQTDLAFLKIKADHPLSAAVLGDSDEVKTGEWVIAVGNPYGFERTVSFGIVSGKGRFVPGADNGVSLLNDFIQTDALIEHGNSGGPLVNMRGEVLGINSIGVGRGQGFTIPINVVKEVRGRTQIEGRVERGWLGIYLQEFDEEFASYLGNRDLKGVMISDVMRQSPAQKAGLQSGDVLMTFNGQDLAGSKASDLNRLTLIVASLRPGTQVPVVLYRNGEYLNKTITIGTQPPMDVKEYDSGLGFTAKEINESTIQENRLDVTKGAVVVNIDKGTPVADTNLTVGDVIVKVDNYEVNNLTDLEEALEKVCKNDRILLTLRRGRINVFTLINMAPFRSEKK